MQRRGGCLGRPPPRALPGLAALASPRRPARRAPAQSREQQVKQARRQRAPSPPRGLPLPGAYAFPPLLSPPPLRPLSPSGSGLPPPPPHLSQRWSVIIVTSQRDDPVEPSLRDVKSRAEGSRSGLSGSCGTWEEEGAVEGATNLRFEVFWVPAGEHRGTFYPSPSALELCSCTT